MFKNSLFTGVVQIALWTKSVDLFVGTRPHVLTSSLGYDPCEYCMYCFITTGRAAAHCDARSSVSRTVFSLTSRGFKPRVYFCLSEGSSRGGWCRSCCSLGGVEASSSCRVVVEPVAATNVNGCFGYRAGRLRISSNNKTLFIRKETFEYLYT
jgi:hypothetical protein